MCIMSQRESLSPRVSTDRVGPSPFQHIEWLRNLAAHLLQADYRERRRLAAHLHDNLQQYLVGVRLKLGIARNRAPNAG